MEINVDNLHGLFCCKVCNKTLSSYKSLWRHNKTFHNIIEEKKSEGKKNSPLKSEDGPLKSEVKDYNCRYCFKKYNNKNSRWSHEQKCKNDKLIELKTENNKLKQELENKNNTNIKNINQNNCNNTTNNQINNGTINNTNNIVINQIGYESVEDIPLNNILKILDSGNNMPINCIKNLNFNKDLPKNHSFCATTLEGKHFTRINHETQKPEKINKVDFINEVLNSSLKFLNSISLMAEFDESFREKIPIEHQNKMKEVLNNQSKFHEPKNKKAFFNCINDMSYNFKDLILETWKLLQPKEDIPDDDSEPPLLDENYKYWSDSD